MATYFAKDGKVLVMKTINNKIISFEEIEPITALAQICRRMDTISVSQPLTAFGHTKTDKNSGKTIRQIQLMWKEYNNTHEMLYEWLM